MKHALKNARWDGTSTSANKDVTDATHLASLAKTKLINASLVVVQEASCLERHNV